MHGSLLRWDDLNHSAAEDVIVGNMPSSLTQIRQHIMAMQANRQRLSNTCVCQCPGAAGNGFSQSSERNRLLSYCKRLTSVKVSNISAAGLPEIRSGVPETGWDPYTSCRAAYADTA